MKRKKRLKVLEAWLGEWQVRLRLRDWDITIREVGVDEMDGPSNHGCIRYHLDSRTAIISVLKESHYDGLLPWDAEATICHELLHLHFAPFDAEGATPEHTAQEQAINAIASALVKAKRGQP